MGAKFLTVIAGSYKHRKRDNQNERVVPFRSVSVNSGVFSVTDRETNAGGTVSLYTHVCYQILRHIFPSRVH